MKSKINFILLSAVFVLICLSIVLGRLLAISSSAKNIGGIRPALSDNVDQSVSDETTTAENGTFQKININTASKEELMTLPGVGESIAQNIIDYRVENGGFYAIEQIKKVKGIGEVKYNNIKDIITI